MSVTAENNSSSQEPNWRKYSTLLLNGVLMVAAFLLVSAFQSRSMLSADRLPAPQLLAPLLTGGDFNLDEVGTRPTLVYFFAPWCHYCAFSSNNLNRLRRWRDEGGLQIIAVALDWKNVSEVRDYALQHELKIPVILGDAAVARDWKVFGFPSYYVIDSQQRIAKRDIGYSTQLGLWWRSWVVD